MWVKVRVVTRENGGKTARRSRRSGRLGGPARVVREGGGKTESRGGRVGGESAHRSRQTHRKRGGSAAPTRGWTRCRKGAGSGLGMEGMEGEVVMVLMAG